MADVIKVKASDGTIYDVKDAATYTKDEVDTLLAGKASVGDSYTKAEDDTLLAAKADKTYVDDELLLKANVVDVYSKTEADNLLAGKVAVGDSYTKAEDDLLLAAKANAADVYTITQSDALLNEKAGLDDSSITSTVATWSADKLNITFQGKADGSDVYTKAEVDALIGGIKMFPDLDWANPVFTFTSTDLSYTATEDCWLYGSHIATGSTGANLTIDGKKISYVAAGSWGNTTNFIPLTFIKAGTTVAMDSWTTSQGFDTLHIFKERSV